MNVVHVVQRTEITLYTHKLKLAEVIGDLPIYLTTHLVTFTVVIVKTVIVVFYCHR